jgi:acetyl esterase
MRRSCTALLAGAVLVLAGCAPEPTASSTTAPTRSENGRFVEDVDFGGPDGVRLDVCLPEDPAAGAPAILSVHGGGWSAGDKAGKQWRDACTWLADEGFVVFQPNYRLAPAHPFPAARDDLETALAWIGEDAQVERFGHDPARLGAFGDSAGGNLVALLATAGDGPGAPEIDAVVELSAPLDLTREGVSRGDLDAAFQWVQLAYLGCDSAEDCPVARDASPMHQVDPSDPPFFVVAATDDFIPVEQADDFVDELEAQGVDVEYERIDSAEHGLGLLDEALEDRIAVWLHERLDG